MSSCPATLHNELLDPIVARDLQCVEEHWRKPAVQNRFGRPKESASAVFYFASDASTFMTGADVVVDDGFNLR